MVEAVVKIAKGDLEIQEALDFSTSAYTQSERNLTSEEFSPNEPSAVELNH
jgi:hypothetical protein